MTLRCFAHNHVGVPFISEVVWKPLFKIARRWVRMAWIDWWVLSLVTSSGLTSALSTLVMFHSHCIHHFVLRHLLKRLSWFERIIDKTCIWRQLNFFRHRHARLVLGLLVLWAHQCTRHYRLFHQLAINIKIITHSTSLLRGISYSARCW